MSAPVPINDFFGIVGDDSPYSVAPPGSFDIAKNVVFRKRNVVEPRPGFNYVNVEAGIASIAGGVAKAFAWKGKLFAVSSAGALHRVDSDQVASLDLTVGAASKPSAAQLVPMRGFAFINTLSGLAKVNGPDDDEPNAYAHGIDIPNVRISGFAGSGTRLATGNEIAYRALLGRKETSSEDEEFWTYGIPSTRCIFRNTSGGTIDPTLYIALPSTAAAGHWLFVYASRTTTADSDDELAEVLRYEITAADITAQAVTWTDTVPQTRRGSALYTNPSRGGIARGNYEAPACKAMAEYRGSMFFADYIEPRRMKLRFNEGGNVTGVATGIGYRVITARRTNGSSNLTLATATTGLQVGMMLWGMASGAMTSWQGSAPVTIVSSPAGPTIAMSSTWTGASDGANVDLYFVDTLLINGNYYPMAFGNTLTRPQLGALLEALTKNTDQRTSPESFYRAYGTGRAPGLTYDSTSSRTLLKRVEFVVEERRPQTVSNPAWGIAATHGDEYDPPLPVPSSLTVERVEYSERRNGIAWSKSGEPHHVPLGNWQTIGDGAAGIVAAVTARDALWLFQEDGRVWRLYGFGEASGWRIDPFDYGYKLVHRNAIAKLDETIYALTTKGLVALTDGGFVNLSDGFVGLALGAQLPATLDELSEGVSLTSGVKHKEIYLSLGNGDSGTNGYTAVVYVFNVRTKAWSTWQLPHEPCALTALDDRLFYFTKKNPSNNALLVGERETDDSHRYADMSYTFSTSAVGASSFDFGSVSDDPFTADDYALAAGDKIVDNSSAVVAYISSLVDANTAEYLSDSGSPIGACTVYKGYEIDVRWRPLALGDAGACKFWKEIALIFDEWSGAKFWDFVFDSEAGSESTSRQTGTATYSGAKHLRHHVPVMHARRSRLKLRWKLRQAEAYFTISALTVLADIIGPRVSR